MVKCRLLRLADFLERLSKRLPRLTKGFHLDHWDCGSSACAIGFAARVPEFRRLGLRLVGHNLKRPQWRKAEGWGAVQPFFGLTDPQAAFLFSRDRYHFLDRSDPRAVAQRIRAFVASGGEIAQ